MKKRTCETCRHDGQCDGLHYCGGSCWESVVMVCEICGRPCLCDEATETADGRWVCEECADTLPGEDLGGGKE